MKKAIAIVLVIFAATLSACALSDKETVEEAAVSSSALLAEDSTTVPEVPASAEQGKGEKASDEAVCDNDVAYEKPAENPSAAEGSTQKASTTAEAVTEKNTGKDTSETASEVATDKDGWIDKWY